MSFAKNSILPHVETTCVKSPTIRFHHVETTYVILQKQSFLKVNGFVTRGIHLWQLNPFCLKCTCYTLNHFNLFKQFCHMWQQKKGISSQEIVSATSGNPLYSQFIRSCHKWKSVCASFSLLQFRLQSRLRRLASLSFAACGSAFGVALPPLPPASAGPPTADASTCDTHFFGTCRL